MERKYLDHICHDKMSKGNYWHKCDQNSLLKQNINMDCLENKITYQVMSKKPKDPGKYPLLYVCPQPRISLMCIMNK